MAAQTPTSSFRRKPEPGNLEGLMDSGSRRNDGKPRFAFTSGVFGVVLRPATLGDSRSPTDKPQKEFLVAFRSQNGRVNHTKNCVP